MKIAFHFVSELALPGSLLSLSVFRSINSFAYLTFLLYGLVFLKKSLLKNYKDFASRFFFFLSFCQPIVFLILLLLTAFYEMSYLYAIGWLLFIFFINTLKCGLDAALISHYMFIRVLYL